MLGIPRRYSHFVYGTVQSGLSCAIAAAIASYPLINSGSVLIYGLQSWLSSWLVMLPIVLFAAPVIRRLALVLTSQE
jgi:Protein of unknown function (DUF2798)